MWLFSLGLAGCASQSRWASTQGICNFPLAPIDAASFVLAPRYPSIECVDAVLDDFGADTEALMAQDALASPYGLVYGEGSGEGTLERLLWAAHAMLAMDLGEAEQSSGRWTIDPFRSVLGRSGPLNARLYDYVTERITSTELGARSDAMAGVKGGTLFLYDLPPSVDGAAVLAHEARHRDGFEHIPCASTSEGDICDSDDAGPWGLQLAVHERAKEHSVDQIAWEIEQSWLDALPERITP